MILVILIFGVKLSLKCVIIGFGYIFIIVVWMLKLSNLVLIRCEILLSFFCDNGFFVLFGWFNKLSDGNGFVGGCLFSKVLNFFFVVGGGWYVGFVLGIGCVGDIIVVIGFFGLMIGFWLSVLSVDIVLNDLLLSVLKLIFWLRILLSLLKFLNLLLLLFGCFFCVCDGFVVGLFMLLKFIVGLLFCCLKLVLGLVDVGLIVFFLWFNYVENCVCKK